MFTRIIKLLFFVSIMSIASHLQAQDGAETRALWITRWDYKNPADVRRIIENAAELRFNLLLFQARGDGTVGYPSKMEPWSDELGGGDPGWDPLAMAVELAHTHRIQLHAWINVYPAWMGVKPPAIGEQLYYTHPEWLMVDEYGRSQNLNRHYVWLSPTHPEVEPYLLQLCSEIYSNYAVDGIHLDYIRYPSPAYSYDPPSLSVFIRNYKTPPQDNPLLWSGWRREAISRFIEKLNRGMKNTRPQLALSASVMGDYEMGCRVYLQDSHDWLARGIIDVIYPMLYTRDDTLFSRQLAGHRENDHNRHVYPGIYAGDEQHLQQQMRISREAGCKGVAIFSYDLLCPNHQVDAYFASILQEAWQRETAVAAFPWRAYLGDNQGPMVEQAYTLPNTVFTGSPFKIAAKITDPSGVYDDRTGADGKGIYLVFGRNWPSALTSEIRMSPLKNMPDWYITDEPVPAQKAGLDFRFRIFAWDNHHESSGHLKQNLGFSDVWSLSVLAKDQTYVCAGSMGPVLEGATCLELDGGGKIWIGTEDSGLLILDHRGSPVSFSPQQSGWTRSVEKTALAPVTALAYSSAGVMHVLTSRMPRTVFRFNAASGEALQGLDLSFNASALDCDASGRLYLLEEGGTRWRVLSSYGTELTGGPFGIAHTGNDIAVLADGSRVFIADRTTGGVQCWHGAIEGFRARYWREPDLPVAGIGSGKVSRDSSDFVYVPHSQLGVISIFNRSGRLLHNLTGGKPPINAPQAISPTATADSLYVLENTAGGPVKLSLWTRK